MEDLKKHQPPMTIEEQIENLKSIGLIVDDEEYGVLGYLESQNFADENYHGQFLRDCEEEIRRNEKTPFVRNFKRHYEGGDLPIYALVELFSFGMLSKFFKNMHNEDKKGINNNRIYGILLCLKHLLKNDEHWKELLQNENSLS